jgi:hypothetical protein
MTGILYHPLKKMHTEAFVNFSLSVIESGPEKPKHERASSLVFNCCRRLDRSDFSDCSSAPRKTLVVSPGKQQESVNPSTAET